MAIIEIQAKTMLAHVHPPDGIFGMRYNMNLYRGCQHQCIYCDSRSACYGIENFADILVKANALDLFARYGFGVHINTKSTLVLRDVDRLLALGPGRASVCFSISTADDDLGRKIEPGAAPVSERYRAMRILAGQGIVVGVSMMPILPFLEDSVENVTAIVEQAVASGARFIIPWFGMSMRDGQREYYYAQLDRLFPGLRQRYERAFGLNYECPACWADQLRAQFEALCTRYGLATKVPPYPVEAGQQLPLF